MLGAEGVKNLIIDRLVASMPTAVQAVAARAGAHSWEIPVPAGYYPSKVPSWDVPTGGYPFVTVTAEGTDGELTNNVFTPHEIVKEFQFGYNVSIAIYTQVTGQDGEPLARLQAERLALAVREALLWEQELTGASDADQALVNFRGGWAEDYDTQFDDTEGTWLGGAGLLVPVTTTEVLDSAPYRDQSTVLVGTETYLRDPVTGTEVPGTRDDPYDAPETAVEPVS